MIVRIRLHVAILPHGPDNRSTDMSAAIFMRPTGGLPRGFISQWLFGSIYVRSPCKELKNSQTSNRTNRGQITEHCQLQHQLNAPFFKSSQDMCNVKGKFIQFRVMSGKRTIDFFHRPQADCAARDSKQPGSRALSVSRRSSIGLSYR